MSDESSAGVVTSARIPQEMLDELDRLEPLIRQLPEYRGFNFSRSTLIRMAVGHGIQRLQALLKARKVEFTQVDLLDPKQENFKM